MSSLERCTYSVALATAMLLHPAAGATDVGPGTARLLDQAAADDPKVSRQAIKDLAASGQQTIGQLTDMLIEAGKGDDACVRRALHGLAAYLARPDAGSQRRDFAEALCSRLKSDRPAAVKRFLIRQLQIVGGDESVPALAACLTDEQLAEPARQALIANQSLSAVKALREALPKTKGAFRAGVIQALGQLRDTESVPLLTAEAKSSDEAVRIATIEALGSIGDAQAEPVIAAALGQGSERAQRVALDPYLRLADRMLAKARATQAFPPGRELRAKALQMYSRALNQAREPGLRCAALCGVSQAGWPEGIDLILPWVHHTDATVWRTASACLAKIPGEQASVAISDALKKAQAPIRARLLRVLGQRKDAKAAEAIEAAAAKDPDAEVRVTAWHLLGRLQEPALEMEPSLLEAAKGSEFIRPVALAAYLKLASARLRAGSEGLAVAMCEKTLKLAASNDALRRRALATLGEIGSESSLAVAAPLVQDHAVRVDALRVYLRVADRAAEAGSKQRAIEILKKVLAMSPPREVADPAIRQLRELGVKFDPARELGFVTRWWLSGPYPGSDIDKAWPPEQSVDLDKPMKIGDRTDRWRRWHTADMQGIVNLYELVKPNQNVTAYLYAEIDVPQAQDAVLKIGSDDGVKCWLNGRAIHRFSGSRGLSVDQDVVEARLQPGANKVLIKVTQGGGDWAVCLRVTDRAGQALGFTQKEE